MAKKAVSPTTAYGTKLRYKGMKSNHPIKSRYMAAALAMIFGIAGVNQFYLRNIVRGFLKILFTVICLLLSFFINPLIILIPVVISLITGFAYLIQSDSFFAKHNHVRTI